MAARTATSWDGTAGPRRSARATRPAGRAQPRGGGGGRPSPSPASAGAGRSLRPPQPRRVPGGAAGSVAGGGPRLHALRRGGAARGARGLSASCRCRRRCWAGAGRPGPARAGRLERGVGAHSPPSPRAPSPARPAPARPPRPPPRPGRGPRPALPGGGGGSLPPGALGRSRLRRRLPGARGSWRGSERLPRAASRSQPAERSREAAGARVRGGGLSPRAGRGEEGTESDLGLAACPTPLSLAAPTSPALPAGVRRAGGPGGEGAGSAKV